MLGCALESALTVSNDSAPSLSIKLESQPRTLLLPTRHHSSVKSIGERNRQQTSPIAINSADTRISFTSRIF